MFLRIVITFFILPTIIVAQVPTNDTVKLLQKKINSIELLNIGASMPISNFGSSEKSATSGFATPGVKLDIGYNIQLYKHLGIKSMFMYQNNQFNVNKYEKILLAENPVNSYSISAGGWNNMSALIGVYANFNLGKRYHIQPYILMGFNYCISPNVDVTVSDSLKNISTIKQERGHAMAFCFGSGLDFKIDLIKNYQLNLGFNYFYSDLKFNKIRVENSYKNSVYEFIVYQPIQTIGFKIGLVKIIN